MPFYRKGIGMVFLHYDSVYVYVWLIHHVTQIPFNRESFGMAFLHCTFFYVQLIH